MKTETYVNKDDWGDGPWQDEPDKIQWVDPDTLLDCLIVRGPAGALCGYVGVDETHPLFKVGYNKCSMPARGQSRYRRSGRIRGKDKMRRRPCDKYNCSHRPESLLTVHGGLTYSNMCSGKICHVPEEGRPDKVFWFGFDCAHYMDEAPELRAALRRATAPPAEAALLELMNDFEKLTAASVSSEAFDFFEGATYRTAEYVIGHCQLLAQQLHHLQERAR